MRTKLNCEGNYDKVEFKHLQSIML